MNSRQLQAAWFKSANADMKREALQQLIGEGVIKAVDDNLTATYAELAADKLIAKFNKAFGFRSGGIRDTSKSENGGWGDRVPCKVDGKGIHIEFFDMLFGDGVGKWLGKKFVIDGITVEILNEINVYYLPELKMHVSAHYDLRESDIKETIEDATGKRISKLEPAKVKDIRKGSKIVYANLELAADNIRWTIPWDANVDWSEIYAAFGENAPEWKRYEMTAYLHVAGRDAWEVKMEYLTQEEVDELIEQIKSGQVSYEVKQQKSL